MKSSLFIWLLAVVFVSCSNNKSDGTGRQKAIEEIKTAEKDFNQMAADKGIREAFWFYADSNAVIKRGNDSLIHGKEGIRNYYSEPSYSKASVSWSPDFTDAADNGDFGYTYGKYTWRSTDSAGQVSEYRGVFHTVWKKQADGTWKYVWD